jgi:electron transfer flavoprotein beta subunit
LDIIVCIKRVPETAEADLVIDETGKKIVEQDLTFAINEPDNYALEEALLLKEEFGGSVTLFSVGPEAADEVLRMALAKGADEAIRLTDPQFEGSDGIAVAKILAETIKGRSYDLIMTGCMAYDDGQSQVGPALAELLGIPHATLITNVEIHEGRSFVKRELEGGLNERIDIELPALLTIQTGINEPRYASIRGIREASRKTIEVKTLDDTHLSPDEVGEPGSGSILARLALPPVGEGAHMIDGSPEETAAQLGAIFKEKGLI